MSVTCGWNSWLLYLHWFFYLIFPEVVREMLQAYQNSGVYVYSVNVSGLIPYWGSMTFFLAFFFVGLFCYPPKEFPSVFLCMRKSTSRQWCLAGAIPFCNFFLSIRNCFLQENCLLTMQREKCTYSYWGCLKLVKNLVTLENWVCQWSHNLLGNWNLGKSVVHLDLQPGPSSPF